MGYSNAEQQKAFQREWLSKRRSDWIESQGGSCCKCGSDDRLEIDHVDRKTKTINVAAIWSRSEATRSKELAKCQILCYGCHKEKTKEEMSGWNHGSTGYNRGCRCGVCKEYKRIANARRYN